MMHKKRNKGFTLVEMMIAIAIGLIVASAVVSLFISMTKVNSTYLKSVRLHHGLRSTFDVMVRDIRRAGYNDNAATQITTNPFSSTGSGTVLSVPTTSSIYFSYDDADTSNTNIKSYGYRLQSGEIQFCFRQDGSTCSEAGASWESISDTDLIEVTTLSIAETPVDVNDIRLREISISMTGRLKKDTVFSRTLNEVIKVRNEHALTW